MEGSIALIENIRKQGVPVAIATGDWQESSLLKLNSSGIPIEGLPMTTSSDYYSRAEIISCSIQKAGGNLENSIYVGDGHWDFKATQKLGIGFIGCGTKLDKLRTEGVKHLLDRLDVESFWNTVELITKRRLRSR